MLLPIQKYQILLLYVSLWQKKISPKCLPLSYKTFLTDASDQSTNKKDKKRLI